MSPPSEPRPSLDRYARQTLFPPLGKEGQQRLLESRALVCGCGALGTVLANTLARAGVGHLRIVDRDFVETSNLQRQVLFDEQDVADGLPKAVAAQRKLRRINSEIEIEAIVADVDHTNIIELATAADVIVDGTDNFETRYLLNDVSIKQNIPWVYGGCLGAEGQTMTILPGETPCLSCLMPEAPPPGSTPTCDTAGILSPIVNVIASIQAMEAIKILSGNRASVNRTLMVLGLWDNSLRQVKLDALLEADNCPTCHHGEFPWLEGLCGSHSAVLCGRNAVQISSPQRQQLSLDSLEKKLSTVGQVNRNPFMLRLDVDGYRLTIFPDGRAIISGTDDIATAKTLFAKYIGS